MINKLMEAFELYEKYLNNKRISFLIDDEVIECIFKESNFLHLTGVQTRKEISPKNFYKKLRKNQIKETHLYFNDYSKMKLDVFSNLQFEIGTTVIIYRTDSDSYINFTSDHNVFRNSAILCIFNKSPKSLLKKNFQPKGKRFKGSVVNIENLKS